jgi:hypothetical protein
VDDVVFLCGEEELDKERRGYARAFARVATLRFIPPSTNWRESLAGVRPRLILNPDGRPWLPDGIERVEAPTAVFHIDTYVATERRIRWSAMYDYSFVFHPHYDDRFRDAGIGGARLLAHAAERDLFDKPDIERRYEVGWVGRSGSAIYRTRDRVLDALTSRFVMNDALRRYTPEEMAAIYRASKIVVNVSRDDYPHDANMRCFEAIASGALLLTQLPTELAGLGFEEGVHFAGYRDAAEVPELVARWLARDEERTAIAARGRSLVLREHTYDARVATILRETSSGERANVRSWSRERVALRRLEYHAAYADAAGALRALPKAATASPLRAAAQMALLAARKVKRMLRR